MEGKDVYVSLCCDAIHDVGVMSYFRVNEIVW